MSGHALLLTFDTDELEFARGFEAGRIWAMLRAGQASAIVETVSAANAEMVIRMAEATGFTASCVEDDDDWLTVTLVPREDASDPEKGRGQ